jgi:endonuclease/exonuclease/phosphatase family metal-dependent hydrolase
MERLRVATLNVWNRGGPWERRLDLIRREIERLAPDLVGLQEVLRLEAPRACQAEEIARGLGYEVAFGPAQDAGGGLWLGNAVLSRFPIRRARHWALPVQREDDARSLLGAWVDAPCGEVPFFVTHLSWRLHEESVRLEQVREIAARILAEAPVGSSFPPLLVGDFNAEPESDSIRYLRGLAVVEGRSVYFADAYGWRGEPPGYTFDGRINPFAGEVHEPPRRLDYVFVRGPEIHGRGEVLFAALAWNRPEDGVYPSDHFGVVADVRAAPLGGA